MPKHEPDPTDPMTLTGVQVPAEEEHVEAMARAFAEEFAACGWDEHRLYRMFASSFCAGPHLAWTQLGETRVRALIADAVRPWRSRHA
ncbi:MAG: hypothetical protein ACYTEZ_01345 [Planctomycetota bacterium]|jgi:hypothetical protein